MQHNKPMDLSTIIGIIASFTMICLAILGSNNHLLAFIDFHSIMIVIFGTFFITLACFSITEIIDSIPVIFKMIIFKSVPLSQIAIQSIKYAEFARKNNIIQLEDRLIKENHSIILAKGIFLINQNEKIDNIEKILTQEILTYIEEKDNTISIIKKAAEIAPAMGLIGTLIGLVQMLGNLNDPSNLGPSMAIALLTTFYGAILSYMLFFPIASKIERNSRDEIISANIYLKTVISIFKNENPRYLQNIINSLLNSTGKINYYK